MPARTNAFQQLVKVLHDQLDSSAEVTESAMLTDRLTSKHVEVDIVVRQEVSGYPVVVSIECRAHKRPQGPGWIDEMVGKHQFLETSCLVLVSESGFTDSARTKAELLGVELLTFEEAIDSEWEAVHGNIKGISLKGCWTFPRRVTVVIPEVWQPTAMTQVELSQLAIRGHDGSGIGPLQSIVNAVFRQMTPTFEEDVEVQGQVLFTEVRFPPGCMVLGMDGSEHRIKGLHLAKEEWLIAKRLPTARRSFRGAQLALASIETPVVNFQLAVIGVLKAKRISAASIQSFSDARRLHCIWDVALEVPHDQAPKGLSQFRARDLNQPRKPKGKPNLPQTKLVLVRTHDDEKEE